MSRVKNHFSIKNLEHLSGIKAHTIRIWEKRYKLIEPNRTDTNIRVYSLENLQKLLNVTLLYNAGVKISKIAKLNEQEFNDHVKKVALSSSSNQKALNLFKLAMIDFDQNLFTKTLENLLEEHSFETVFNSILVHLMNDLGVLWLTNSISPAHEHFLSSLIKQKIHSLSQSLNSQPIKDTSKTFVLFLPDDEIHELGLLYLNYELLAKGYKTIYLGPSVPMKSLESLQEIQKPLHFISYLTVEPSVDKINDYIDSFEKEFLSNTSNQLWLLGTQVQYIQKAYPKVSLFHSIPNLTKEV
ncbi:MAG: MerR family transcriptional regulator [Flavobacteriaceae bacterium]|nr:MerR family transcriptional regulator [Flavobacteriaceae bacterium]